MPRRRRSRRRARRRRGRDDGAVAGELGAGQGHRDYVVKTLLHGLDGPIDGRTYAGGVMAPMGSNRDEWIAAVASYVRNSFGNVATS